jgi:CheY-like chemotaxis protein
VRIEVADTGIGITEEQLGRLFQPFSQADISTSRRYGGTGLGLAICRRLVELMDGEIGCHSEEGSGSTFWFEVPFHAAVPVEPAPSPRDLLSLDPARTYRVLVAEDNPVNQLVAVRLLAKLGVEVEVVANGALALEALQRDVFDLVLMDCQMPEVDGYEATARLRELRDSASSPRIPVVALTANAMSGDRERCLAAGMDDYLSKPFTVDDLGRVLASWLPH